MLSIRVIKASACYRNVWNSLFARLTNHVSLLRFSICKSDSDGFFNHSYRSMPSLLHMPNTLHRVKDPFSTYCSIAFNAALLCGNRSQAY